MTCRSLSWTLLTIISTLMVAGGVIAPQWLVGEPHSFYPASTNLTKGVFLITHRPTIGIFNKCANTQPFGVFQSADCSTYVEGFRMPSDEFPDTWKSGLIVLTIAVSLLAFTNFTAIFSLCIQAIFKKSIFTVSGLIQSIAGLLLIIGQVLYPIGWDNRVVREICGDKAAIFYLGGCHIGWGFYTTMCGTAFVFVCAILSMQAETSTSSDKVENKILQGKTVICIP